MWRAKRSSAFLDGGPRVCVCVCVLNNIKLHVIGLLTASDLLYKQHLVHVKIQL